MLDSIYIVLLKSNRIHLWLLLAFDIQSYREAGVSPFVSSSLFIFSSLCRLVCPHFGYYKPLPFSPIERLMCPHFVASTVTLSSIQRLMYSHFVASISI